MKHLLLLFSVILAGSISAQTLQQVNANIVMPTNQSAMDGIFSQAESAACGPDTNGYTLAKATGLQALNVNNATSAGSGSQYFDAPQSLSISGVSFYAWKPDAVNGITMNVTVAIYAAAADSTPAGMPLATTTTVVDTVFSPGTLDVLKKHAVFTSPVTVTSGYVVVVSNPSGTPLSVILNSWAAAPPDGQQEWLASALIGANWLRGYELDLGGGVTLDADWLFEPHVSYNMTSSFLVDDPCFSTGLTLNFTNTSSPVLNNRMYNIAEFQALTDLSYTWNYGDGTPQENGVNATHTYAASGAYTVTLTDTLYGWTSNCSTDTMIAIGSAPTAAYSSIETSLTSTFTNTSTSGAVTNYLWDFGDGNTSTMMDPVHTYAVAGTYTVCLTVADGCGADSTCSSITVSCAAPTPAYSSIETNFTSTFTNTSTSGSGTSYFWDFGDGNTSTQMDPIHTYAVAGTYTVCLTVADVCGADSTCSPITVSCPTPAPNFNFITSGSDVAFTDASTAGLGATYLWDLGDGNTSTQMSPTHTYGADGSYTVCLTVTDACGTDSTCQTVTVSSCINPVAGFTSVETPANSGIFDFTNTSTTTGATTYDWDFGDGNTSTIMNPSNTYASGGTYTVTLTVTDSCGTNTFSLTDTTVVGVDELSLVEVAVYPNPSNGIFTVSAAADMETVYVTDLTGKLIYTGDLSGTEAEIDATQFANGTYFLSVRFTNDIIQTVRLEVVK